MKNDPFKFCAKASDLNRQGYLEHSGLYNRCLCSITIGSRRALCKWPRQFFGKRKTLLLAKPSLANLSRLVVTGRSGPRSALLRWPNTQLHKYSGSASDITKAYLQFNRNLELAVITLIFHSELAQRRHRGCRLVARRIWLKWTVIRHFIRGTFHLGNISFDTFHSKRV